MKYSPLAAWALLWLAVLLRTVPADGAKICAELAAALSPENVGFIGNIVRDRDDHTAALVYADFLEERGDAKSLAKAAAIRLAIEIKTEPYRPTKLLGVRVNPLGDRRLARLAALQREAGWAPFELVVDGHPCKFVPDFTNGVATTVRQLPGRGSAKASLRGYAGSIHLLQPEGFFELLDRFPEAFFIKTEFADGNILDVEQAQLAYIAAVAAGYPGPLSYFRHTVQSATPTAAPFLPMKLIAALNKPARPATRDGLEALKLAMTRHRALFEGAEDGPKVLRFFEGTATSKEVAELVRDKDADPLLIEQAVACMRHAVSQGNEPEVQTKLYQLAGSLNKVAHRRVLQGFIESDPPPAQKRIAEAVLKALDE